MRQITVILAAMLLITACGRRAATWHRSEGAAWGTYYHITYLSDRQLDDSIVAEMERVNRSLSMFEPQSLLSRINRGERTSADALISDVIDVSRRVWQMSGGRFDPTVGPLTELWGFGRRGETPEPDSATVAATLASVGFDKVRIKNDTVVFAVPGMRLDFGAVAKGYGVDRVASMLRRNGCGNYMVEIGGEVAASGVNHRGELWHIMIESPQMDGSGEIITLDNRCVATSGNYRNYRERPDGSRYAHTLDPLTGYPRESDFLSVTVIAPTCAEADALATACMAMPAAEADSLAATLAPRITIRFLRP